MTSDLDQDRAAVLETCRGGEQFVPVIHHGLLMAINRRSLDTIEPGPDMTVEDYVVGLELLDHRFWVVTDADGNNVVRQAIPIRLPQERPESWSRRAEQLTAAWPKSRGREILAYLLARDGVVGPEFVTNREAPDHAA